jgi:hypothetical protein
MKKFPAKSRLARVRQLLVLANNLPDIILNDDDFRWAHLPEGEKDAHKQKFREKSDLQIEDAGKLIISTRSFIRNFYDTENEYFRWVNNITFSPAQKGLAVNTFNIVHNQHWQRGKASLIELLKNIESDEDELAKIEQILMDKTATLRYACLFTMMISMCVIWTIPIETLSNIIPPALVLSIRVLCSALVGLSLISVIASDEWKKIWIPILFTVFLAIAASLRTGEPSMTTMERADSLHKENKTLLLDSIKKTNNPKR